MIRFIYIAFVMMAGISWGQQASPSVTSPAKRASKNDVKGLSVQREARSTYNSKAEYWADVTAANPSSADAWYNYYRATQYGAYSPNSKRISATTQVTLDSIVHTMEQKVPESYEYNLLKYVNSKDSRSAFPYLQKAYQINPENTEAYDELIGYYEMTRNSAKKKEICKTTYRKVKYSSNKLEYAYNLLNSVSSGAILFTNGEVDTYPLWIQQEALGIRKDVKVINLDLIKKPWYRNKLFAEWGIKGSYDGVKETTFIKNLMNSNPGKEVFVSLTVKPIILKNLQSKLYLTGTAFQVSNTPVNNTETLKNNWAKHKKAKIKDKVNSYDDKKLNNNYLLMLSELYQKYKDDDKKVAQEAKKMAQTVGVYGGVWDRVKNKFE